MAKPVVDGLEHSDGARLDIVRVDIDSESGASLASRHGIRAVPAFLLLDSHGTVLYRQVGGRPDVARVERLVATSGAPPPQ